MKLVTLDGLKERSKWLRVLAYGPAGCGKTWLCGSAATDSFTSPVLYVSYRSQSQSLAHMAGISDKSLVHLEIEEFTDLNWVLSALFVGINKYPDLEKVWDMRGLTWPPKTVAFDSVTEMQRYEVLRLGGNKDAINEAKIASSIQMPKWDGWGQVLNEFTMFGNKAFNMPFHIVMTCLQHVKVKKLDDGETIIDSISPALQGQGRQIFPSTSATVMYMKARPPGRTVLYNGVEEPWYTTGYTAVSSTTFARDNTAVFPTEIHNPTIPRMAKMLHRAWEESL